MISSIIKQNKDHCLVTLMKDGKTIRKVKLITRDSYIINPVNKNNTKNKGRLVVFKDSYCEDGRSIAKVQYLDTNRSGKVECDSLDYIDSEVISLNDNLPKIKITEIHRDLELLLPDFNMYLDILTTLENKVLKNNIAYITQKELSRLLNTSSTNISKKLKQLIRFNAIEKVSDGCYELLHNDIFHTPFNIVAQVYDLVLKKPDLVSKYQIQSNMLDVSMTDIKQAWGYLNKLKHKGS